jgi:hypothetical protein
VLKGITNVVTDVEDLWLLTADLYASCDNVDNAREVGGIRLTFDLYT